MNQSDLQEKVTEIEIRLAHMDQALNELSDVVFDQQKLIKGLEQTCDELRQRTQAAAEGTGNGSSEGQKPPHY